jgi:hypothetical protein
MRLKPFLLTALLLPLTILAQDKDIQNSVEHPEKENFLKINLTSLPLKNYHLQYERVLSRKVSVAIGARVMPNTGIPLKSLVLDAVGDDQDTRQIVENSRLQNIAITPEVRFYLGKGYGKGFYIAPYYRYTSFSTENITLTYAATAGPDRSVDLKGELSAHSGGIMFGAQWFLGKSISLDWWIVGAHYGAGNGSFSGTPDMPFTPGEQDEIRRILEDIDVPLIEKKISVSANNVSATIDGPFGGLRGGILLGIRF